jgi:hypothetical protein
MGGQVELIPVVEVEVAEELTVALEELVVLA